MLLPVSYANDNSRFAFKLDWASDDQRLNCAHKGTGQRTRRSPMPTGKRGANTGQRLASSKLPGERRYKPAVRRAFVAAMVVNYFFNQNSGPSGAGRARYVRGAVFPAWALGSSDKLISIE